MVGSVDLVRAAMTVTRLEAVEVEVSEVDMEDLERAGADMTVIRVWTVTVLALHQVTHTVEAVAKGIIRNNSIVSHYII